MVTGYAEALAAEALAEIATLRAELELERYTCIGKGGVYERIGSALGAGSSRGGIIEVYRDTGSGQLYFRDTSEFFRRMERLETTV